MAKFMEMAIKSAGGKEELSRKFNEYCDNDLYINENLTELLKSYNEKWIAIYDSELVASSSTFISIIKNIKEKNYSLDDVHIQFITQKPKTLIL
jgi:hypothetical protein